MAENGHQCVIQYLPWALPGALIFELSSSIGLSMYAKDLGGKAKRMPIRWQSGKARLWNRSVFFSRSKMP
jgi:hypothetical protein